MSLESKWPTHLDKSKLSNAEWVKLRTLELYDYLPQTSLEERYTYTDIRDEVIELNYAFFGYVATHTFINNSSISYTLLHEEIFTYISCCNRPRRLYREVG